MELNVSNIQHFSTVDGPGIRTTIFLKGCNLHCPWCHNPENLSAEPSKLYYENLGEAVIYGKRMSINEVFDEVIQDADYYTESGGGVTLSGGEAMLQAGAVAMLAKRFKEHNVPVWIDTAGNVPYECFEMINEYIDGYLYDYKAGTEKAYKEVIGGDLRLVSDNLKKLLSEGKKIWIRIPLIPEFNTSRQDVEMMCENLRQLGANEVFLIPFHRMGSGKYKALGLKYEYEKTAPLTKEQLEEIKNQFSKFFITKIEY